MFTEPFIYWRRDYTIESILKTSGTSCKQKIGLTGEC